MQFQTFFLEIPIHGQEGKKITVQILFIYITPVKSSGHTKLRNMSWTSKFDRPPFCTGSY